MKRNLDALSAGVQRKRQKIRSARNIASESSSNAIRSGSIPVQEFLSARKFEIRALVDSIQKSREAGVQRAFQSLPRYLRRRAASHNVKRVPRRLRARALAELTEEEKKTQHRRIPFKRKRGRLSTMRKLASMQRSLGEGDKLSNHEPVLIEGTDLTVVKPLQMGKFVHRQRNKTWLPSHLWTCKRAKMETKWNYAIARSPNEKTYRSTHRASTSKGAIVFDTSFQGSIVLTGPVLEITQVLELLTGTRSICGLRARKGQRCESVHVMHADMMVCPIHVLWNSASTDVDASVLLTVHPAEFPQVWKLALSHRTSLKLEKLKILDMRFQIGSIEVIGPMATNALLSVLKSTDQSEIVKAFRACHGLSPNELPSCISIPLQVQNPKLLFPPKLITEPAKQANPFLAQWPTHSNGSPLFSLLEMQHLNSTRPKTIGSEEARVPTVPVLVQRTLLGLSLSSPWAYITDFWYSLNHLPLVRFGGLQEYAQIHYEHSLPFFPIDYPGTAAGDSSALEERNHLEKAYLRRPPAKRINYTKAVNGRPEPGDPFACDFPYLFTAAAQSVGELSHVSMSVLGQDTTVDVSMGDLSAPLFTSTPQLPLQAHYTPQSVPKQTISQDTPVTEIQPVPVVPIMLLPHQLASLTQDQVDRGLIQVRIRMKQRGCPTSRARLYHKNGSQPGPLIGFITTGNFSLSEGRATGLASLRYHGVQGSKKGECFVRGAGTSNFLVAEWYLLV